MRKCLISLAGPLLACLVVGCNQPDTSEPEPPPPPPPGEAAKSEAAKNLPTRTPMQMPGGQTSEPL